MPPAANPWVEEFLALPGDTFHDFHELHAGEIVEVVGPSVPHYQMQKRLERMLAATCSDAGYEASREFYYTLPGEARRADVALFKLERLRAQGDRVFFGAPELVIEILSPSNPHMDVDHIRALCVAAEGIQFWVINMQHQTLTVYGRNRSVRLYVPGDEVTLGAFGVAAAIAVAEIFERTQVS